MDSNGQLILKIYQHLLKICLPLHQISIYILVLQIESIIILIVAMGCCPVETIPQNQKRKTGQRPKGSIQIDNRAGNELRIRQIKTQNSCSLHFIKYLTKYNKILADFIERESEDFNQDSGSSILDSITQQQIQAYFANETNRQIKKSLTQCLRKPYGLIFIVQQKQRVFILSMDVLTSFIQQIFQSFSEGRKGQIALDKKKIEKFNKFKKNGAIFFEKIEKIVFFLNKMEKKYFFKVEQLQTLTAKVRKVQHENSELKGQIKGLENLPKLVDEIKREKNGEGQPKLGEPNYSEHESTIEKLRIENSMLDQQNNLQKAKVSQLEAQIQILKNNQSKRQNEIIELKEIAAKSLSEVQAQLTAMSDTLEIKNKQFKEFLTEIETLKKIIDERDLKISSLNAKVEEQTYLIKIEDKKILALNQKIKELQEQCLNNKYIIAQKDVQIGSFSPYVEKLQRQISELKELNKQISMKISDSRLRSRSFVERKTLFYGTILQQRPDDKKYLIRSIEHQMKKPIEKTALLYEFRRDRARNFHELVDSKSNLIVIIETEKALLAGYYSGELQEKTPMTNEAMIVSLTNRKYYTLKKDQPNSGKKESKEPKRLMRGMTYDKFYLIFGNAEIRIKTNEDKIFSNFAISSAYFENNKDKVDVLLNEGTTNDVKLLTYEIYEIIFEEQMMQEMVQE